MSKTMNLALCGFEASFFHMSTMGLRVGFLCSANNNKGQLTVIIRTGSLRNMRSNESNACVRDRVPTDK